jgi:DNA-binding CsgD family transcriptional regulator
MLMSAAYVVLGRFDQGLKIAREAYGEMGGAHTTVRAELTLNLAIAHYRKGEYAQASRLLDSIPETYYSEVIAPDVRSIKAEGRTIEARYAMVLGLLEERRGNRARAEEAYRRAFDIGRESGLMRGAAIVAYRLFALTGEKQYENFIASVLTDASDRYWVKARLLRSRTEARLTPRQIEVMRLVPQGLSNKEIGTVLGVSEARVRNILAALFPMLGVRSRAELATVASARGLLRPE